MPPDFIFIRCLHCGHVFKTSAGAAPDRLAVLLPVLRLIRAKCTDCRQTSMIGDAEICWPPAHAA
jgi:ribosomal protein S27E